MGAGNPRARRRLRSRRTARVDARRQQVERSARVALGLVCERRLGGTSFAVVDGVPTTESLHGVWGSGPKDVWVVGDAGTILHFDGATWTKATAAFPLGKKPDLRGVWGSGPNDVWVVGDAFALHFTGKKAGR